MLDKKYDIFHLYGAKQKKYKSYVPSLSEQVKRIEKMQRIAGNIPYQRLVSSQGENYQVGVTLSALPKLYSGYFFFSALIEHEYVIVTIKEKDKYLLMQTLGTNDISCMDSNNRYYRHRSRLAQMKLRAEKLGSKVRISDY